MYQKTSHRIALSKFLLAIPVLALCLLVASFTQRKPTPPKTFTDGQYQSLFRFAVKANSEKKIPYILTKKNEYLIRFLDEKTRQPIAMPKSFKILDKDNKEMDYQKMLDGLQFIPTSTDMYTIVLNNDTDNGIEFVLYFRNKGNLPTTEENGVFTNPQIAPTMPIFIPVKTPKEYPKEAFEKEIEGEAIVSSIVNVDGTLSDIKIEKGLGYGCDEVALEKVRNLKNIIVGKHEDKNVRTRVRTRVVFEIYPLYLPKTEIPTQVLQSIPFSTTEAKITLEKGKKYVFTISELEGLSKEELDMMSVSLDAKEGFQIAFINALQMTFVYKPKETGEFKIKMSHGKSLKAGKLIIGIK